MEKRVLDRRLEQMKAEGVKFVTNAHVGHSVPVEDLQREFDVILLAGGAEQPRDLKIPGRELKGIHFAMEFLPQANKRCAGDTLDPQFDILASGQTRRYHWRRRHRRGLPGDVHRQKPLSVHQFEIMPMPPDRALAAYAVAAVADAVARRRRARRRRHSRVEHRHHEVHRRRHGNVKQLHAVRVGPPPKFEPIAGSEFMMDADLVLIAMGFLRAGAQWHDRAARRRARRARQCRDGRGLHDVGAGSFCGGRYAARAVAGGVGDCRRHARRRSRLIAI